MNTGYQQVAPLGPRVDPPRPSTEVPDVTLVRVNGAARRYDRRIPTEGALIRLDGVTSPLAIGDVKSAIGDVQ